MSQRYRHLRRDHAAAEAARGGAFLPEPAAGGELRRRGGERRHGAGPLRLRHGLRLRASRRTRSAMPAWRSCAGMASTPPASCARAARLGIYFLEAGANQRPSVVIYDRAGSAIAEAHPGDIDWDAAFRGAHRGFTSPGSPPPSPSVRRGALPGGRTDGASSMGLTVSCDLNYRKNLWKYGKSAPEVMGELMNRWTWPSPTRRTARRRSASPVRRRTWSRGTLDAGAVPGAGGEGPLPRTRR